MAQSQNTKIDFQTTGTSYLGIGGKVGKFLVGDKALEFYADANVEDYIQIPLGYYPSNRCQCVWQTN